MKNLRYLSAAIVLTFSGTLFASSDIQKIGTGQIATQAKQISDLTELIGLQDKYIVSGTKLYPSYFLGAKQLIFGPNAKLVFSSDALKSNTSLVVAAITILNKDPSHPGTITWSRGDGPSQPPPRAGQAPAGANARDDGANGQNGSSGAMGNQGNRGAAAPDLTIFVEHLNGAPPIIDFTGQNGGQGGVGETGGNGGDGHQGSPASESLVDCKAGPGRGGNGGNGGNSGRGGIGGTGGTGGNGGNITLVSLPKTMPTLLKMIRFKVSGGEGGPGGAGGPGGKGGYWGAAGTKALPYCHARPDRHGNRGSSGATGSKGDRGADGVSGTVAYTTLTAQHFSKLFGK